MNIVNIIFGLLVTLASIFGVIALEGGNLGAIFCLSPFLLILGGTIGALIVSFSFLKVLKAFLLIFSIKNNEEPEIFQLSSEILSYAGKYSIAFGIIGFILGTIFALSNLSDLSELGSGLAVSVTSILYGVGFAYVLLFPLSVNLKNRKPSDNY